MSAHNSIAPGKLSRLTGSRNGPVLVDVRTDDEFCADPRFIPGAIRRDPASIADWAPAFSGRPAIVISREGGARGHGVAAWLRDAEVGADTLEGGHIAWAEANLPLVPESKLPPRDVRGRTVWVTRARPKVDRIAVPWLIRRFVDPNAVFLFVAASEVLPVAEHYRAAAFDIDGVFWGHRGDKCTFDALVEELALDTEPLRRLALIVRGADTGRPDLAAESAGLVAVSLGLSGLYSDDLEQLEAGFALYDALYRWASDARRQAERHIRPRNRKGPMSDITLDSQLSSAAHGVSLGEAIRVWLRVALLSFGGPAGQIAVVHRILVDEKKWVSESRFLHALNYCMLLPGPEAQQLATYIGWLMHGTRGGIIAGGLFVLPGAIAIMVLSLIYAAFGNVGMVTALFFGLKAAVLAMVLQAVARVGKRALKNNILRGLAAVAFVAIFFFDVPFPLIILTAGVIGYFGGSADHPAFAAGGGRGGNSATESLDSLLGEDLPEHVKISTGCSLKVASIWLAIWLFPVASLLSLVGGSNVFSQIALFFSKMAVVTFGGAYAVLAYVAQQAVENFHWLRPGEMLDGLGMAETTPGPLIMVLQFVGFMAAYRESGVLPPLLAGALGGLLTTWVTFTPCFLWIFLGAPYIEQLRGNKALTGALSAITAAVVGVILNLAIWFAIHTIFHRTIPVRGLGFAFDLPLPASVDAWALLLSLGAVLAIFGLKAGLLQTLGACAAAGVLLFLIGAITPGNAATRNSSQIMAPRSAQQVDLDTLRVVSINMPIIASED